MSAFMNWILTDLGEKHPMFGCEAEFQLELALWFRTHIPRLDVRLEVNAFHDRSRDRLDLALVGMKTAVELKYAPDSSAAADTYRHGFIKDICRLEKLCSTPHWNAGHAIIVAARSDLWTQATRRNNDREFEIYNQRNLHGKLRWAERTSQKIKSDYPALEVDGHYRLHWKRFGGKGARYLAVDVH
ncbi:MAG: hypothetical protein OXI11_08060 [Gammaproteobacteria bacterium]|nr:hypothetical protein [Gammaproteobacteria bacterium]